MSKIFIRIFFFLMLVNFSFISNAEEKVVAKDTVAAEKKPLVVGEVEEQDRRPTTILLFGDGVVAGYKLTESETLAVQLQKALSEKGMYAKVINGGITGETTAGGRERIVASLKRRNPEIVFIALGNHDMLKGFLLEAVKSNLRKIIEASKENGSFVILSEVAPSGRLNESYRNSFAFLYKSLAEEYKIPLYPPLLSSVSGMNGVDLQEDGLHPNPEGVKTIATSLADYFVKNMGSNRQLEKARKEKEEELKKERERLIKIREENEARRKKEEEELIRRELMLKDN
jgi:acyl-CoA thioesterase-1